MILVLWYLGAKSYILKDIRVIFNKSRKNTVIDVFGGSAKVLLNLNAKIKIYNVINTNLVNFFTELKNNKKLLLKELDYLLNINEDNFILNLFGKPNLRKEYTNF